MSIYSERRGLPVGWWLSGAGLVLAVVWIFLAVPSVWGPIVAFVVATLLIGIPLLRMARQEVRLTNEALCVGDARLPLARVSSASLALGEQWRQAVTKFGGPRTWISTRGHHPGGLIVHLTPADDPYEIWVISACKPEQFAAALGEVGALVQHSVPGGSDGS